MFYCNLLHFQYLIISYTVLMSTVINCTDDSHPVEIYIEPSANCIPLEINDDVICLYFVDGGSHDESAFNCKFELDGELVFGDSLLHYLDGIENINKLTWIGLKRKNGQWIWNNGDPVADSVLKMYMDNAQILKNNKNSNPECAAMRFKMWYELECDEYLSVALCQRVKRDACHKWTVPEKMCFWDEKDRCIRKVWKRYHEPDLPLQKCPMAMKQLGYQWEPCENRTMCKNNSCRMGQWSAWSPCKTNCSYSQQANGSTVVVPPYTCFAACKQSGQTYKERVAEHDGTMRQCPMETQWRHCVGDCAENYMNPVPVDDTGYKHTTKSDEIDDTIINVENVEDILQPPSIEEQRRHKTTKIWLIVAISLGVTGSFLIVCLLLYRTFGWRTKLLATRSSGELTLIHNTKQHKICPTKCPCPKTASSDSAARRKKKKKPKKVK